MKTKFFLKTSSHGRHHRHLPTCMKRCFKNHEKFSMPIIDAVKNRKLDAVVFSEIVSKLKSTSGQPQVHLILLGKAYLKRVNYDIFHFN